MKKVIAILAIATLTACGGSSTTPAATTPAATTDTTKAPTVDSTTTDGGSGLVKPGKEQPEHIK